eukprot:scaffold17482_cov52-Attheya_sp.AAC.10
MADQGWSQHGILMVDEIFVSAGMKCLDDEVPHSFCVSRNFGRYLLKFKSSLKSVFVIGTV